MLLEIPKTYEAGERRAERLMKEVMTHLFRYLPPKKAGPHHFELSDGTKCWLAQFSSPCVRDGEWEYGFDIKMEGNTLDHLEFRVTCSGWGM